MYIQATKIKKRTFKHFNLQIGEKVQTKWKKYEISMLGIDVRHPIKEKINLNTGCRKKVCMTSKFY